MIVAAACGGLGLMLLAVGCMPDVDALGASWQHSKGGGGSPTPSCTEDAQCPGKTCVSGVCMVDPCLNGLHDGTETDIDCGGEACDPCKVGKSCNVSSDCATNVCSDQVCVVPSCTDGVRDLTETDIDCGGECSPDHQCWPMAKCLVASDCQSYLCNIATLQCDATEVVPADDMIDDMESQTMTILDVGGRTGSWFRANDGSSTQFGPIPAKIPGARAGSKVAEHTTGQAFTGWGAGIGVHLRSSADGTGKTPYDASGYTGFEFWSRSDTDQPLKIQFIDTNTYGGGDVCTVCGDAFLVIVTASKEWTRHKISFSSLKQEGWGDQFPSFKVNELVDIQFTVANGQAFDLWIDDMSFLK